MNLRIKLNKWSIEFDILISLSI